MLASFLQLEQSVADGKAAVASYEQRLEAEDNRLQALVQKTEVRGGNSQFIVV